MKINCEDNQKVELEVIGYQFPSSLDKEYDGNWLRIYLKVESKVGCWQTIDPSLLTWDVHELIIWFYSLANNEIFDIKEQEFIEPNISFYLLSDFADEIKCIKIMFDLESRPKSAKDEIEYSVIFFADKNELIRIASELEIELKKFPVRKS